MASKKQFVVSTARPNAAALDQALDQLVQPLTDTKKAVHRDIPIERISPNPFQARRQFAVDDLAATIREQGFTSTLHVRPMPGALERYELVFGERRLRAAKAAGLTHLPCVIAPYTDPEMIEIGLTENIQREDLNPLEEAQAFQQMIASGGYTYQQLATRIGKHRSYIEGRIALLRLPDDLQDLVRQRPDTIRLARDLGSLPSVEQRRPLIRRALDGELSGRDIQALVRQSTAGAGADESDVTPVAQSDSREMPDVQTNQESARQVAQTSEHKPRRVAHPAQPASRFERQIEQTRSAIQIDCARWRMQIEKLNDVERARLITVLDEAAAQLAQLRAALTP